MENLKLKKFIRLLLAICCLILLWSCSYNLEKRDLENGFAKKPGKYTKPSKTPPKGRLNILYPDMLRIDVLDDGRLNFSFSGRKTRYVGLDLFKSFYQDEKWALYWDDADNLWFYSEDPKQTTVWLKKDTAVYVEVDYCKENITLPTTFLEYLDMNKDDLCTK